MSDPIQQLHEIPDLAVEVFLTWGHKNPTEAPIIASRTPFPAAPADLEALDCLRPGELGLLFRLTQCVRAVAETLRDAGQTWPPITNPPTWVGECAWLLGAANIWRHDLWLLDYVTDEINTVWRNLAKAARLPQPQRLTCPQDGCGWPVHPEGGNAWRCEAGHQFTVASEAARLRTATIPELARELDISQDLLRQWKHRGIITPCGKCDGRDVFRVELVRRARQRVAS